MERMKVEIDSEELKRLRSREEKYLAYMDMLSYRGEDKTYVDALCGKVAQLEEENKKLKSDLAFERTMLDNVRAEYKSLQNVIKKLKDIQGEVNPTQKSKTITVTDEDNRIILEKGEDGKRHRYGGGNVVLC